MAPHKLLKEEQAVHLISIHCGYWKLISIKKNDKKTNHSRNIIKWTGHLASFHLNDDKTIGIWLLIIELSQISLTHLLMRVTLGWMPSTQFLVKDLQASPMSLMDCRTLAAIIGLKTLSSKCPLLAATETAVWFPITWAATIVTASHWVGFTLP